MTSYSAIQAKIDKGLGRAATVLGPPSSVYRANETAATGDFPAGWTLVSANTKVYKQRMSDTKIENALKSSGSVWFQLYGDMRPFRIGDVFMVQDPSAYGIGSTVWADTTTEFDGFALSWHPPIGLPAGARVSSTCRVYRPSATPGLDPAGDDRWTNADLKSRGGLMLVNGLFSFGSETSANSLPIGIGSSERPSRATEFGKDIPTTTPESRYYGYLPLLHGYTPHEGDEIIMADGARYTVVHPYMQAVGATGSQVIMERTQAGPG